MINRAGMVANAEALIEVRISTNLQKKFFLVYEIVFNQTASAVGNDTLVGLHRRHMCVRRDWE